MNREEEKNKTGKMDEKSAAYSIVDFLEARHLLAADLDQFVEGRARTYPQAAVGGAINHHGREVGFENGVADEFVEAAFVMAIACHELMENGNEAEAA
jgi:hypothetical protein